MQILLDYINELNWLAVVVASMAAFASGAVWYAACFWKNLDENGWLDA